MRAAERGRGSLETPARTSLQRPQRSSSLSSTSWKQELQTEGFEPAASGQTLPPATRPAARRDELSSASPRATLPWLRRDSEDPSFYSSTVHARCEQSSFHRWSNRMNRGENGG